MAGQLRVNFKVLIILLGFVEGVLSVVDFTSVTASGSLQNMPYVFIASYLVTGDETAADIKEELGFSRSIPTGDITGWTDASNWLPMTLPNSVKSRMFKVTKASKGSVGVFQWTYDSKTVTTILMRPTASLLPTFVSRTVNRGDAVSLTVTRNTKKDTISESKWRINGGTTMKQDILQFNISSASTSDSGIYECHYKHERATGNQALLRLIVIGCPPKKYGPPDCNKDCLRCRNGGVCDQVDGGCICPPGFSGKFCQQIRGPNLFGQEGSLHCDSVGLPSLGSTCKGMLFCLPDPYGCSCAAGYQGLNCKKDCNDGTYGANCAQTCHCADGVSCDGATGRCNGDCAAGYTGNNCQVQCTAGTFGANCAQTCHCADGPSCNGTAGRCNGSCAAGYTGKNCQEPCVAGTFGMNCAHTCHCATESLCDRSTGQCDTGQCAQGYTGDSCQEQCLRIGNRPSCNTTCTMLAPNMKPQSLIVSSYSGPGLPTHTLSWDPVFCPANKVNIVNYVYKLLDGHGSDVQSVAVEGTSVNLNLSNCTSYQLKVAAQTSKGIGNYSMEPYTTKSKVPNPVTNVTVSYINDTQMTLSLDAPVTDTQSHRPATDYLVTYDLIYLEQCRRVNTSIDTLNTTATTITIDRLEAYSTYRVNITSRNHVGRSTPSTRNMTTKQSKPEAPTVIVNSVSTDHIEFAWDLPCGKRGGSITEYQYRYRKPAYTSFIDPNTTTDKLIRITSLTPCTLYVFQVTALNSIGEGPWSNKTKQQTTKQAPWSVKALDIQPDGHDKLNVSWQAKQHNPCPATDYLVTYELISIEQCQEGDRSGGSLNVTDSSLTIE